ncbi:MAG TPA: hypothetical protein VG711_04510, partial [Phycisphaerales bacterium]|nr:hypothetical protein [Phycisphaerales bacterium]
LDQGSEYKKKYDELKAAGQLGENADKARKLLDYRTVWPHLVNDAESALMSSGAQDDLFNTDMAVINEIPPGERRLIQLEHLSGEYVPPGQDGKRKIHVTMDVEFSHKDREKFVNDTVGKWLRDNAERPGVPYKILNVQVLSTQLDTRTAGSTDKPGARQDGGSGRMNSGGAGTGVTNNGPKSGSTLGRAGGSDAPPPVPGSGLSLGSSGGGAPKTPKTPTQTTPSTSTGNDDSGDEAKDISMSDLATMAPMPTMPQLFPPGSTYYRIPVTFEVELLDEKPATGPQTAQNTANKKEGSTT